MGRPEHPALGDGRSVIGWYEAEAIPPNESELPTGAVACKTIPPLPEELCASGGGRSAGSSRMAELASGQQGAGAGSGMYDVTWWYHCGKNDHFGDRRCGGQTNPPPPCLDAAPSDRGQWHGNARDLPLLDWRR
jgi:hypothetical protein